MKLCWVEEQQIGVLVELVSKKSDELIQVAAIDAFDLLSQELLYGPLGVMPDDEMKQI